jgi:hypothetical protein
MLSWLWPKRQVERDPFRAELKTIEADCLRRLSYVDLQLNRVARNRSHWDSAMTVVETDIVPLSPTEHAAAWFRSLRDWQWYLIIGALAACFLLIVVSIAFCGGNPGSQP